MTDETPATLSPPKDLPLDATLSYGRRLTGEPDLLISAANGHVAWAEDSGSDPATFAPTSDMIPAGPMATSTNRYRLIRVVGRGGMGEVWEAEQLALRRRVAVKRLLPPRGDDRSRTREIHRSFRQEAMVSGRLEHPNIVPVHDLGEDDAGNPLMAMKLVKGRPWNDLLREDFAKLRPAEILARHLPTLVQMAQAVAFAHSQRIVHRDLKPAQVMVGEFGEVLLADWGLAVHLDEGTATAAKPPSVLDGTEELPLASYASNPSGTPAMMAPEQTLSTPERIGPWTDVFLLGGTLYFVLTGTYPYQGKTSLEAFFAAADCRLVPPSQRAPDRYIPQELEALCLDAMRAEPRDRVASAKEFLARLQDYLSGASRQRESEELAAALEAEFAAMEAGGLPASPQRLFAALESLGERLARALELWPPNTAARRLHARVLALRTREEIRFGDLLQARVHLQTLRTEELAPHAPEAPDLAVALDRAERARERARRQRTALMTAATVLFAGVLAASAWAFRQQRVADTQRHVAMDKARDATELKKFLLTDLGDALDPNVARDEALIAKITEKILEHYRGFDLEGSSPEMTLALLDDMVDTADALRTFARFQDGLELVDRAIALCREQDPVNEELLSKALIYRGAILGDLGEMRQSIASSEEALAIRQRIDPPDAPTLLKVRVNIAAARIEAGDIAEALAEMETLLPLLLKSEGGDGGEQTRLLLGHMGSALRRLGRFPEADDAFLRATAIAERMQGPESIVAADEHHRRAVFLIEVGRTGEARELLHRGLDIMLKARGPNHPSVGSFQEALASAENNSGNLDAAAAHLAEALRIATAVFGADHGRVLKLRMDAAKMRWIRGDREASIAELEKLADEYPAARAVSRSTRFEILETLVFQYSRAGRTAEAEELANELLPMLREAFGPRHHRVAEALATLAPIQESRGEFETAEVSFREALALMAEAYGEGHSSTIRHISDLGLFLGRRGRLEEALELLLRAAELRSGGGTARDTSIIPEFSNLGNLYAQMKRWPEARDAYAVAAPLSLEAAKQNDLPYNRRVAMTMYDSLAEAEERLGHLEEATAAARVSVEMMQPLSDASPADLTTAMQTSNVVNRLARILRLRGLAEESRQWYERNLAVVAGPGEPTPEQLALHIRKGLALTHLGRHEEALPIIRYWTVEQKKRNPELDEAAAILGIAGP